MVPVNSKLSSSVIVSGSILILCRDLDIRQGNVVGWLAETMMQALSRGGSEKEIARKL